ncbi:MAG: thiamine pyrophosphate-dependent enzyme [Treponema sp.]|nr:thiamine pyrophosphate-dependent enzyme [Treponema sp.]MEE3435006.1 thiamine pyrophosphate-dependent enzyme [Treponema sp.]
MEEISKKLRKEALYLSHKCKDGNLQSVFSCLDIMWVLYDKIMNWTPEKATNDDRDFFIISKGQATLALYPILIEKGMFDLEEIASEIGNFDSRYCIQTDLTKFNGGIENNAGSLGHGLPFATGIAYANKIKKSPSKVFVLCGDGELCEGTMWESFIFAGNKKLDNLCVIIDDNDSVGAMVSLDSINEKLKSFGFDVFEVNGHNMNDCETVLLQATQLANGKPKAIIAHTVRGYGSKTMTEHDVWFHKAPNTEELEMLSKEVDEF